MFRESMPKSWKLVYTSYFLFVIKKALLAHILFTISKATKLHSTILSFYVYINYKFHVVLYLSLESEKEKKGNSKMPFPNQVCVFI